MSEEVIGTAGSKEDSIFIKSAQFHKFRCTNCDKKKIHCIAGGKKGEAVELLKDRCNNNECECRCRRFYIANNGKLKLYGTIDDTDIMDGMTDGTAQSDFIDKLNKKWNKR